MKLQVEFDIKPFDVPDTVCVKTAGLKYHFALPAAPAAAALCGDTWAKTSDIQLTSISLASIDSNQLSQLCDKFTDQVFNKAGKTRPPQQLLPVTPRPQPLVKNAADYKTLAADLENAKELLESAIGDSNGNRQIEKAIELIESWTLPF